MEIISEDLKNVEEITKPESIDDSDSLYYRIHKCNIDVRENKLRIMPVAFDPKPPGSTKMSCDWSRHSTPDESQNRARKPTENYIVSFNVRDVKGISLNVEHSPSKHNHSHSHIFDIHPRTIDTEIRVKLTRIASFIIFIKS